MTDFSQLLDKFVKEKKIHIYSMAKYCGIDRSTLYKIINGKRLPPISSIRDKMANFMQLTPDEIRQFNLAWTISTVGKSNYYRRKSVEAFLLNFPNITSTIPGEKFSIPEKLPDDLSCISFSGKNTFYSYLQYIIKTEYQFENGKIGLLIQPDNKILMQCLNVQSSSSNSVRIEHLFCLESTEQLSDSDEYCFFDYFENILLPFKNGLDYHPYCFYDNISAHFSNLNLFSDLVLTTEYVLFCTHDYAGGILCHEPNIVEMIWNLFSTYQNICFPVLKKTPKRVFHYQADSIINNLTKGKLLLETNNDVLYLTFEDMHKQTICLTLYTPMFIYSFIDYLKTIK